MQTDLLGSRQRTINNGWRLIGPFVTTVHPAFLGTSTRHHVSDPGLPLNGPMISEVTPRNEAKDCRSWEPALPGCGLRIQSRRLFLSTGHKVRSPSRATCCWILIRLPYRYFL